MVKKKVKCKWCGRKYWKKHNRQEYCNKKCREEAKREHSRMRSHKYYTRHKEKNQNNLGSSNLKEHMNTDTHREAVLVHEEKKKILGGG
ncbi:MAG: hypothetical protein BZ136_09240 [Methanosphaera sp. rholeuAM74]|nr:MAG: hypothetical protein BZ136_09240 [Methanosphaera sp. rholeuAM74]